MFCLISIPETKECARQANVNLTILYYMAMILCSEFGDVISRLSHIKVYRTHFETKKGKKLSENKTKYLIKSGVHVIILY